MKKATFITLIVLIVSLGGCNEQQFERADQLVADVNNVAAGGQAVLSSPAGGFIPSPAREIAGVTVSVLMAAAAAYQTWRKNQMAKTTKAIVKGVESIDREHQTKNPNPAMKIKQAIGVQMRALGVYDAGNKIVDQMRIS